MSHRQRPTGLIQIKRDALIAFVRAALYAGSMMQPRYFLIYEDALCRALEVIELPALHSPPQRNANQDPEQDG